MNKRLSAPIALFAIFVFALMVFGSRSTQKNTATVKLMVAPSGATVKLDGKGIKQGTLNVSFGQHNITASKSGFQAQTKSFTVQPKETRFVGIALTSNSASTADWYNKHPADAELSQEINNQNFGQGSNDALAANPLLRQLPHLDFDFRIDYGVPLSSKDKSHALGIYIH